MKPVRQTKFSLFYADGRRLNYGNCLVACIASFLEMPVDEVPNIYTFYGLDPKGQEPEDQLWSVVMNIWLRSKFGKELRFWKSAGDLPSGYVIIRGKSMRNKPHTCIYENSTTGLIPFYDPHPTEQFLSSHDYYITIETI